MARIQPTLVHHLDGGPIVQLFGKPYDWSLRPDESGQPKKEVTDQIEQIGIAAGCTDIAAPVPTKFNAKICDQTDLEEVIPCGQSRRVVLTRGQFADGVFLVRGSSFFLASADCLTVIAYDPKTGFAIPAHAGRDCLIDKERIKTGQKFREHDSVVDAIVACFNDHNVKTNHLHVWMACGVYPFAFEHDWDHRTYGRLNRNMVTELRERWGRKTVHGPLQKGKLDLQHIVRAQFEKHGVPSFQIGNDAVNTYGRSDLEEGPRWWSYRRAQEQGKTEEFACRNGVLVLNPGPLPTP